MGERRTTQSNLTENERKEAIKCSEVWFIVTNTSWVAHQGEGMMKTTENEPGLLNDRDCDDGNSDKIWERKILRH